MEKFELSLTVNGTLYQASVDPRTLLSDFLRAELSLTGTHVGCEHGVCGACTVLLDGVSVRSCLILARRRSMLSMARSSSSPLSFSFSSLASFSICSSILFSASRIRRRAPAGKLRWEDDHRIGGRRVRLGSGTVVAVDGGVGERTVIALDVGVEQLASAIVAIARMRNHG